MAKVKYNHKRSKGRTFGVLSVYIEVHEAFNAVAKNKGITMREFTEQLIMKELREKHNQEIPLLKKLLDDLETIGS